MGEGLGSFRFSELGGSIRIGDAGDSLKASEFETDPMEVAALVQEMDAYFPSDMALGDLDTFATDLSNANALDGLLDPNTLDDFKGLLDSLGRAACAVRETYEQKPGVTQQVTTEAAYPASNLNSMNPSYTTTGAALAPP